MNATAVWSFTGLAANVTRSTSGNSGPGGSDSAIKHFVDAYITIGPDGTNTVGDPHTFTVNVKQDDGRAAADPLGDGVNGFGPAPNGTLVDVDLTDSDGAANSISDNTCDNSPPPGGTVNGACSVTFTSPSAGTVTGHATVVFSVDGVELSRETDDVAPNSDDAVKVFVAGSIRWTKQYAQALQAGATFQVCRTNDYILPFGPMGPALANPVCFSVTDNDVKDRDTDDGEFLVSGLALGRYTVKETAAPPGFELDPKTETVDLTPGRWARIRRSRSRS